MSTIKLIKKKLWLCVETESVSDIHKSHFCGKLIVEKIEI